jgi:hypothetical protein
VEIWKGNVRDEEDGAALMRRRGAEGEEMVMQGGKVSSRVGSKMDILIGRGWTKTVHDGLWWTRAKYGNRFSVGAKTAVAGMGDVMIRRSGLFYLQGGEDGVGEKV